MDPGSCLEPMLPADPQVARRDAVRCVRVIAGSIYEATSIKKQLMLIKLREREEGSERERKSVCVCVCEREREKERERAAEKSDTKSERERCGEEKN